MKSERSEISVVDVYTKALIRATPDGHRWDEYVLSNMYRRITSSNYPKAQNLRLWNSIRDLDTVLFDLENLVKKAKKKKQNECTVVLQKIAKLVDRSLRHLDPDFFTQGKGFRSVTSNRISLILSLEFLSQASLLFRQYYYRISIQVESKHTVAGQWTLTTPTIYHELSESVYALCRLLYHEYSELPLPEPAEIEEPRLSRRSERAGRYCNDNTEVK